MKINQIILEKNKTSTISKTDGFDPIKSQLVLAFSERTSLEENPPFNTLKATYPNANIIICSTSGQISDNKLIEKNVVATALQFEKTEIKVTQINVLTNTEDNKAKKLVENLPKLHLKAILVLSEGTNVNGTELIEAMREASDFKIPIFGGLAGDEAHFTKTLVGLNEDAKAGSVVAVGFYGEHIKFGFGSKGGWGDFGPERQVTHSDKNVLYKIDDVFALDLYKEYLGKYAEELPGASLFFPLSMRNDQNSETVVRTILSINEQDKSMTFAGNIPVKSYVRLMKANFDNLIEASYNAASNASNLNSNPEFAFLVSCVGRKLVLGDRIEEELEAAKETFGNQTILAGFYSYGEISPNLKNVACDLHNQTMTITTISEN